MFGNRPTVIAAVALGALCAVLAAVGAVWYAVHPPTPSRPAVALSHRPTPAASRSLWRPPTLVEHRVVFTATGHAQAQWAAGDRWAWEDVPGAWTRTVTVAAGVGTNAALTVVGTGPLHCRVEVNGAVDEHDADGDAGASANCMVSW